MLEFIYGFFTDIPAYFSQGEYGWGTILSLMVLGSIVALLGCLYGLSWLLFNRSTYSEDKTTKGKVVKTSFVPEHGGTHIAPVFTGNGFGTAVTSDYEEEKDIVVLKTDEIGRVEIDSAELLENVEKGDNVHLTYQEKYTHWVWNSSQKTFNDYILFKVKVKDGTEINV